MRRAGPLALALVTALLGAAALLRETSTQASAGELELEDVVLLHGLARSDRAMHPLEESLRTAGYRVHNLRYPSLDGSPEELVALVARDVETCCAGAHKLHFVTHSLGGLLVRAYLAQHPHENLGRVVMLAPPNHGSEYADLARDAKLGESLRTAAAALGTDPESFANSLPPPTYEVGIIAGTKSRNPLDRMVVEGESDGAVSVASAQLAGMSDFITVEATHATIRRLPIVHQQVIAFLQTGHFRHREETRPGEPTR